MESNITEQQYSAGSLSEPHFDEATLMSARPVVPLHEIKAAERSSKRLTFGLALVAALIIGAVGATLIYRQRGEAPATATIETVTPEANEAAAGPTAGEAGGGISDAPVSPSSVSISGSAKASNVSAVPKSEARDNAALRSRKPARETTAAVKSTETRRVEVDDQEERKAARRAERQEARRLRQEAQRQAWGEVRSRRAQRSDDLLRIREIFEGPRKP